MNDRSLRHVLTLAIERFAMRVSQWAGSGWAFGLACSVIVLWLLSGHFFGYSDTWQLVVNTGTTIVTFLMVFLIQRSQNKESRAVHLKLNELVAALEGASNRMIAVEDLDEEELEVLSRHYRELARMAKEAQSIGESHSIEEAEARHDRKYRRAVRPRRAAGSKS